jgi:hypothetical protein
VSARSRVSSRKLLAWLGEFLVALVVTFGVLLAFFSGAFLNGYCRLKVERAFAKAHPGSELRIGQLDYSLRANRLIAESAALKSTNTTLKTGRISVMGVRWIGLLSGASTLANVLANASLDATNLDMEFRQTHYEIRCARLQASAPSSELSAQGIELRPLGSDEEFFAARSFRRTRFHVVVPECKVLGLVYGELLRGKSYVARSVHFSQPSFDALVNLDKPAQPFVKSPLMLHEALAAIPQPLKIDSLTVTNGNLRYCEQLGALTNPAVLTFSAVNISAEGVGNCGEPSAAIRLHAQGNLMDAGVLTMQMSIPIAPTNFSLRYSGSLAAMNLTNLNAFLDLDARTRIKSGTVDEAGFEIAVAGGQARGHVSAKYKNLEIAVLDKRSGAEGGFDNRVASLLANALKIRSSNAPDASGSSKEGEVLYSRQPDDEFQQFLWFALRTGVLDIISH